MHSTYKWSWILLATKPRLHPDQFVRGKFTARLTTTKYSSTGLLTAPSSFAMLSALPWAKATLLHLRRLVPSPRFCPLPLFHRSVGGNSAPASALARLGCVCGWPRLRGIGIFSPHFSEVFPCVTAQQARATHSDGRYSALELRQVPKYRRGPLRLQHHWAISETTRIGLSSHG